MQEALFVTWLLWMHRNNLVFRGEFSFPFQVASRARQEVEEFHHSFECIARKQRALPRTTIIWEKPQHGYTKINWDAACNQSLKRMGIRIVARDEFGKVVAATAKVFPCIGNPLMAEAMGVWYAVQLGRGMGWSHVILEGDFLGVVSTLQKTEPCWSSV
jgi:hypothetical protein